MPAYLDPNSWLITRRRNFRPLHADIDPTPTTIEQCSSDFRAVAGLKFAFASRETDLKSDEVLETAVDQKCKNQSATRFINLREALEFSIKNL